VESPSARNERSTKVKQAKQYLIETRFDLLLNEQLDGLCAKGRHADVLLTRNASTAKRNEFHYLDSGLGGYSPQSKSKPGTEPQARPVVTIHPSLSSNEGKINR
jgi:hypothetical protein